jgi:hypothetical protein
LWKYIQQELHLYLETYRCIDMMKVIGTFWNYANIPQMNTFFFLCYCSNVKCVLLKIMNTVFVKHAGFETKNDTCLTIESKTSEKNVSWILSESL